jgi:hypothetical protein
LTSPRILKVALPVGLAPTSFRFEDGCLRLFGHRSIEKMVARPGAAPGICRSGGYTKCAPRLKVAMRSAFEGSASRHAFLLPRQVVRWLHRARFTEMVVLKNGGLCGHCSRDLPLDRRLLFVAELTGRLKMVGCVGNAPTLVRWTSALQAARDLYAPTNPDDLETAGDLTLSRKDAKVSTLLEARCSLHVAPARDSLASLRLCVRIPWILKWYGPPRLCTALCGCRRYAECAPRSFECASRRAFLCARQVTS